MDEVLEFLRSHRFDTADFVPDGVLRRSYRGGSSKSAWCVGWQNARTKDGTFYYVVVCGDYRTDEKYVYTPAKLTRVDKKAVEQQIADRQAAMERDKLASQLETAELARSRFSRAQKSGRTPYMDSKSIPELYSCRIYQDRLQVPLQDVDGNLWNLQSIFPPGPDNKRFMKGGRIKGLFHRLGPEISDVVYLAEGFATAASIYQAVGKPTVCAFNSGNLVDVAKELAKAYPDAEIRVCGDDDRRNEKNVGREKAEKAALLTSGVVIFPQFGEGDGDGTDFNDLHLRLGIDTVRSQLVGLQAERKSGFVPLGYLDSTYFIYNIPSRDIVKLTNFTPPNMYRIAPKSYWDTAYASDNGKTRMLDAADDLIQACVAAGPLCPENIRGTGVWRDKGRVVVNLGSYLLVDGHRVGHSALKSRYFYIRDPKGFQELSAEQSTDAEGAGLAAICQLFNWENPRSASLLAGWVAIARVASALKTRPHLWLTGPKGCGKSEILNGLLGGALGVGSAKLHVEGATTEAGLRQALRASALPIIFDEFEISDKNLAAREAVLEFLRSGWSQGEGVILKGSAAGQTTAFTANSPALLSSIRVVLQSDADQSRFSVLELLPHGDNTERGTQLQDALSKVTEEFGERLFARMVALIPAIEKTAEVFLNHLAPTHGYRYGRQIGTLLAGLHHLSQREIVTREEAAAIVAEFHSSHDSDHDMVEMADEHEALHHLLTWRVELAKETERGTVKQSMSIADALRNAAWHPCLVAFGIKVIDDHFVVANRHAELSKIYRGTHWPANWSSSLRRAGGSATNTISFGSRMAKGKGVAFNLSIL